VIAGGSDQGVQIGADRGWVIGVGVARPEPAAEVVDLKFPKRRHGGHRGSERVEVEDLRADVHMQPQQAQSGTVLDAPHQVGGARRRQPELRALVAGEDMGVGVGRDSGGDADQHVLGPAGWHNGLQPVDVIGIVDHDQTQPVLDR
jgi:hypothetical protein